MLVVGVFVFGWVILRWYRFIFGVFVKDVEFEFKYEEILGRFK